MAHEVLHVHPPDDPGLGGLAGIVAVVRREGRGDGRQLGRLGFGRRFALLGFRRGGLVVHLGIGLLLVVFFLFVIFFLIVVGLVEQIRRGPVKLLLLGRLGPAPNPPGLLAGTLLLFFVGFFLLFGNFLLAVVLLLLLGVAVRIGGPIEIEVGIGRAGAGLALAGIASGACSSSSRGRGVGAR